MNMTVKDALYAKFDNIMTRPGRGGSYPYIRWQDVADRMNQTFGTNWSSKVESQEVVGNNVIVRVSVTVTDPATNMVQVQEGFGGAPNDDRQEAGNPYKAAYSKAFKDAVKRWGVGLFTEEEGEQEVSSAIANIPSGYTAKEYGVPAEQSRSLPQVNTPTPMPDVKPPMPAGGGMSMPAGIAMASPPTAATTTVTQEKTSNFPSAPPVSSNMSSMPTAPSNVPNKPTPPPAMPGQFSSRDDMPMSKVNTINTGEVDYISDVQRAALHSIISKSGMTYENLVKEAFEFNGITQPIPEIDKLTYSDAVKVVKYGNDKFRSR